jgi:surface polysaccharide O-acyltransferase-like enzyme
MDSALSARFRVLRFPLIVGVVFIHNYSPTVRLLNETVGIARSAAAVDFVRNIVSQGIARVSVPLFYAVAGYLFFADFDFSFGGYLAKLKRRIGTLLIPLIFWNVCTLAVFAIGQHLRLTARFFTQSSWPLVADFHPLDYANAILGVWTLYPIDSQFWFIRDLLVLVLLAPVLHFALSRKLGLPLLGMLLFLWLLDVHPSLYPSPQATLFFCLGAYFASTQSNPAITNRQAGALFFIFGTALVCNSLSPKPLFGCSVILAGVPFVWWLTGIIGVRTVRLKEWLFGISSSSFFVFAAHEPLLTIFRKLTFAILLPKSAGSVLFLFFAIPIMEISLLVFAHRLLRRALPSVTAIATGDLWRLRGTPVTPSTGALITGADLKVSPLRHTSRPAHL